MLPEARSLASTGWRVAALLLSLLVAGAAWADAGKKHNYQLRVEGDLVSLRVEDGSLVEILEKLGGLFGFEVIANLRNEVSVNADFDELQLSAAIRQICADVGYVEAPDPETGKIARLVLVSGGDKLPNRAEARREPLAARPAVADALPEIPDAPVEEAEAEATNARRAQEENEGVELAGDDAREQRAEEARGLRDSRNRRSGNRKD
jgi:hypothetical protein